MRPEKKLNVKESFIKKLLDEKLFVSISFLTLILTVFNVLNFKIRYVN